MHSSAQQSTAAVHSKVPQGTAGRGGVLLSTYTKYTTRTGLQVLAVGVVDDGQAEQEPVGEAVVLDDRVVLLLGHEARQGAEPSVADELGVAQLARRELQLEVDPGHRRLVRVRERDRVDQDEEQSSRA